MEMEVIKIINEVLPEGDVKYSEDYFDDGLDSMGVMSIISLLQDKFSFEIDPADITADNFSNFSEIMSTLKKYQIN